ncbi:MAG: glutamate 5-kinase [Candidatus Omnitrophota bacterium]
MKKLVIKIGSSIIAPAGKLDNCLVRELIADILATQALGYKVILVSSGAIACGADALGITKKPTDAHSLMALASLGQIILMDAYRAAFGAHQRNCAQILLTWDDFDNRKRFLNARATIDKLLAMEIIPIINENDAVSSEEIKFGDNDRLGALVTDLVHAGHSIILSDVAGLLDEAGAIIPVITKIDAKIYKLVKVKSGAFTSGGMQTKLQAAEIVTAAGATLVIASGHEKEPLRRIMGGEHLGTRFVPAATVSRARKRWIAFSKKIKGKIYIDAGAKKAILENGRSLLAVGISTIEGDFKPNDSVCVLDATGAIIGCGLANYSSDDLREGKGKKFEKEIIHRDNFVKNE